MSPRRTPKRRAAKTRTPLRSQKRKTSLRSARTRGGAVPAKRKAAKDAEATTHTRADAKTKANQKPAAARSAKGWPTSSPRKRSADATTPAAMPTAERATAKPSAAASGTPVALLPAELEALREQLEARLGEAMPARWNPDPDEVRRAVMKLVLTVAEFIRQLLERQAVRRMEAQTLTPDQVEAVGLALMRLEEAVHDLAKQSGLEPSELNLDLGPLGRLL